MYPSIFGSIIRVWQMKSSLKSGFSSMKRHFKTHFAPAGNGPAFQVDLFGEIWWQYPLWVHQEETAYKQGDGKAEKTDGIAEHIYINLWMPINNWFSALRCGGGVYWCEGFSNAQPAIERIRTHQENCLDTEISSWLEANPCLLRLVRLLIMTTVWHWHWAYFSPME